MITVSQSQEMPTKFKTLKEVKAWAKANKHHSMLEGNTLVVLTNKGVSYVYHDRKFE